MSRKNKILGVERLSEASHVLSLGLAPYGDSDGEEIQVISGFNLKAKLFPKNVRKDSLTFIVFKMNMYSASIQWGGGSNTGAHIETKRSQKEARVFS